MKYWIKPNISADLKSQIFITAWSTTCGITYQYRHLPERQDIICRFFPAFQTGVIFGSFTLGPDHRLLKKKTVSGLLWSVIDSFANQGITFLVGIILARLLSPKEFGLIGMITIFIAISSSFINSGFGTALIRKQNCSEKDFSTVFYFNLAMGILFFGILYLFVLLEIISLSPSNLSKRLWDTFVKLGDIEEPLSPN